MKYDIQGGPMPVVICQLDTVESVLSEAVAIAELLPAPSDGDRRTRTPLRGSLKSPLTFRPG